MVQRNGGSCYTNEKFLEAEKAIKEEMGRLLRENPGMTPQEARRLAEKDNWFIQAVVAAAGAIPGIGLGAGVGLAVEVAIGAGVGAAVGAVAGATVVAVKSGACPIQ